MHLSPSISPGGVLEFALDPHREVLNQHSLKEASTGEKHERETLNCCNSITVLCTLKQVCDQDYFALKVPLSHNLKVSET